MRQTSELTRLVNLPSKTLRALNSCCLTHSSPHSYAGIRKVDNKFAFFSTSSLVCRASVLCLLYSLITTRGPARTEWKSVLFKQIWWIMHE